MQPMGWPSFMTLPPPHATGRPPSGLHHHPTTPPSQQHPSQQQQRERAEREQRDREEREQQHHQLAAAAQQEANEYAAQQSLAYLRNAAVPQSTQISRPSSVPNKVDYPPPPAHSRSSKSSSSSSSSPSSSSRHEKSLTPQQQTHQNLPKAEPNVSLFGYSGYQPSGNFVHDSKSTKSSSSSSNAISCNNQSIVDKSDIIDVVGIGRNRGHPRTEGLSNPPPLLSDHKSSVIVKNEGSNRDQQQLSKQSVVAPAHSPSPKMMPYLNVSPVTVSINIFIKINVNTSNI